MIKVELPPGESVEVSFEGTDGAVVVRFDNDAERVYWRDYGEDELIREEKFVDHLFHNEDLANFSPSKEMCEEARQAREGLHDDE